MYYKQLRLTAPLVIGLAVATTLLPQPSRPSQVLVVLSAMSTAYQEALEGFRATLGESGITVIVAAVDEAATLDKALGERPRVVVAMGGRATEWARSLNTATPVISTMIIDSQPTEESLALASVTLVLRPEQVLAKLKAIFPAMTRLTVVYNPENRSFPRKDILVQAQRLGYVVRFLGCRNPKEVLDAFASLRGAADLVWCYPERDLYQPAMVSPMILTSIRNRVPIVGFSESFVRAGALVGVYPDYRDIGVQTAELVRNYYAGYSVPALQAPRSFKMAINQRVARALGIAPELVPGEKQIASIQ